MVDFEGMAVAPECRDSQDTLRDIPVAPTPSLVTTAYCAPAARDQGGP